MAEYTLMNKNHPVVSFRYDRDIHAVVKIVDVHDLRYAPVALADSKGIVTRRALNDWWRRRAIPASRHQIQQLLDSLNLNSTLELAEENFGLSLSDRYWINDSKNPLKWEDVNFFDNDFTDDLGMLTLGQKSSGNPNLMSPNSTLGGDLNKKWKIVNGRRILVKGGTGSTRQEVLNEVVATALYNRLLSRNDYVPYFLFEENGRIYSACENMLGQDEELVTAYDVLSTRKKPDSISDYDFLVDTYKSLGLKNVEEGLAKMFTCDYILANQDRHWRNFGVIRNVETLEFTRLGIQLILSGHEDPAGKAGRFDIFGKFIEDFRALGGKGIQIGPGCGQLVVECHRECRLEVGRHYLSVLDFLLVDISARPVEVAVTEESGDDMLAVILALVCHIRIEEEWLALHDILLIVFRIDCRPVKRLA